MLSKYNNSKCLYISIVVYGSIVNTKSILVIDDIKPTATNTQLTCRLYWPTVNSQEIVEQI